MSRTICKHQLYYNNIMELEVGLEPTCPFREPAYKAGAVATEPLKH